MIWMSVLFLLLGEDASKAGENPPVALTPYRVEIRFSLPREPRWSDGFIRDYTEALHRHARRSLGSAWQVRTTFDRGALVQPSTGIPDDIDKLIWISLDSSLLMRDRWIGAEYDRTLRNWSPMSNLDRPRSIPTTAEMFDWILELFRPTAEIVSKSRSEAQISLRGESLLPARSRVTWVNPHRPMRVMRSGEADAENSDWVAYTYLRSKPESVSRKVVCSAEIISAYRDPLSRRSRRRIKHIAIAVTPSESRLTLVTYFDRKTKKPLVGLQVALRPVGEQVVVPIGTTGPAGSMEVRVPGSLSTSSQPGQVYDLLLRTGDVVLARVPLVPGSPDSLAIETSIDPLFTEVAGRLVAFQEDLIDLSARRRRLELIRENVVKKAVDQNDLATVRQLTDQLNTLPRRAELSGKLETMKGEIEARSTALGQSRLGPEVRRLFLQCEALVERQVPLNPEVIDANIVPASSPDPAPTGKSP